MRACNFPGARTIGKPASWDDDLDGSCGSIFVTDHVDTLSGMNFMYSVYLPTPEEIEAVVNGAALRLGVMGVRHPVFQLGFLSPRLTRLAQLEPKWDLGPII